jgi:hypothetical protein
MSGRDPVFQFGTGKDLQLERALAEPPARQRRGANNLGAETSRTGIVTFDTTGDEQPRDKTVIVEAIRRPIEAAVTGAAVTPDVEARIEQDAFDPGAAAQAVALRGIRFQRLRQRAAAAGQHGRRHV